ncbi:MAG: hypothetical protein ACQEWV_13360 [Bacillota bacterium]
MKKWNSLLYLMPVSFGLSFYIWAFITQDRNIEYWWHFAIWAFGFLFVSLIVLGRKLYISYGVWLICSSLWMHTVVFSDPSWFDLILAISIPLLLLVIFLAGVVETIIKVLIKRKFKNKTY